MWGRHVILGVCPLRKLPGGGILRKKQLSKQAGETTLPENLLSLLGSQPSLRTGAATHKPTMDRGQKSTITFMCCAHMLV